MINKYGKKRENTKGFTLVELVVVMVIMGILIAGSAAGLASYGRFADFKRNNENAETIFAAAQSSLSQYKATGKLESFQEELKNGTLDARVILPGTAITNYADVTYDLYYFEIPKGISEENLKKTGLYSLIKNYVHNQSVYDASIRIEFDPVGGTVFSVLYSDKATKFSDSASAAKEADGTMGIAPKFRGEKSRKEVSLGYYSTEIVEQMEGTQERARIQNYRVVNGDKLYVEFSLGRPFSEEKFLNIFTYTYEIYTASGTKLASIVLNDESQIGLLPRESVPSRQVSCPTTLYDEAGDPLMGYPKDLKFDAYVTTANRVVLVLDAIDLKVAQAMQDGSKDLSNTYSIARLGLSPLENKFRVAISAVEKGVETAPTSAIRTSDLVEAFVSSTTVNGSTLTYNITNARHLFNVHLLEAENAQPTIYKQSANINWNGKSGAIEKRMVYNSMGEVTAKNQVFEKGFPAISELKEDSTYMGNGYSIQNIVLVPLIDTATNKAVENLGFFGINSGKVERIMFKDAAMVEMEDQGQTAKFSENNAGIVAGLNQGTITGAGIEGGKVTIEKDNIGAVVGMNIGTIENTNVKSITVVGRNNVGGLVGNNDEEGALLNCTVDKATIQGPDTETGESLGGALGVNTNGRLNNIKVTETKIVDTREGGASYGGLLGKNLLGTVENCSVTSGTISTEKGTNVGGLIGENAANIANNQVDKATIKALRIAGGLVGVNHTAAIIDTCTVTASAIEDTTAGGSVGGAVGVNVDGDLTSIHVTDTTVKGTEGLGLSYGGIVGVHQAGTVSGCDVVRGSVITETGNNVGGIVGDNASNVQSCTVEGLSIQGVESAGLLAGIHQAESINNCVVKNGNVTTTGNNAGGLVGINSSLLTQNTISGTLVKSANQAGGIAGLNNNETSITDCTVTSVTVEGTASNGRLGGVVGVNGNGNIGGVLVDNVTVRSAGGAGFGGIAGLHQKGTIYSCTVQGGSVTTSAGINAGGIVGENYGNIANNRMIGTQVQCVDTAGGIVGAHQGGGIDGCHASGANIVTTTNNAGGIAGVSSVNISNCSVENMAVKSAKTAGGLVGTNNLATVTSSRVNATSIEGTSQDSTIGGAVGINGGTLSDISVNNSAVYFSNADWIGNRGELYGVNQGTINGCFVDDVEQDVN